MVLTAAADEPACDEAHEPRCRVVLLSRDDVDEEDMDRRNEVRRLCGEKREVRDWKREVCMVAVAVGCVGVCGCVCCEGFEWLSVEALKMPPMVWCVVWCGEVWW